MTENIYSHRKRLRWIAGFLHKDDRVLEFGCGTGSMITLPLLKAGYRVTGIDLDAKSIRFGRGLLRESGLPARVLVWGDVRRIRDKFDAVIASEVLEHLDDPTLEKVIPALSARLKPGGLLLVTVPNGYGWFEKENAIWKRWDLGRRLEGSFLQRVVFKMKRVLLGWSPEEDMIPSTLADSPHVQCFTWESIAGLLERKGFQIVRRTGSGAMAGPLSHLFFSGVAPWTFMNNLKGSLLPEFASGFFLACRKAGDHDRP